MLRALRFTLAAVMAVGVIPPVQAEDPAAITIIGPSHAPLSLAAGAIARLPAIQLRTAFLTDRGIHAALFEGPLLWTVLCTFGVIDPAMHKQQVRQIVAITGRDGYQAVLALGEIAPEFEGKQVILAERMDGKTLGPDHLRVVVPLDKRGGRSVRDVVRIEVSAAPAPR